MLWLWMPPSERTSWAEPEILFISTQVDPLVPSCGAAIRVLGYVYEYLFQLQAYRLRQRVAELASA